MSITVLVLTRTLLAIQQPCLGFHIRFHLEDWHFPPLLPFLLLLPSFLALLWPLLLSLHCLLLPPIPLPSLLSLLLPLLPLFLLLLVLLPFLLLLVLPLSLLLLALVSHLLPLSLLLWVPPPLLQHLHLSLPLFSFPHYLFFYCLFWTKGRDRTCRTLLAVQFLIVHFPLMMIMIFISMSLF